MEEPVNCPKCGATAVDVCQIAESEQSDDCVRD